MKQSRLKSWDSRKLNKPPTLVPDVAPNEVCGGGAFIFAPPPNIPPRPIPAPPNPVNIIYFS